MDNRPCPECGRRLLVTLTGEIFCPWPRPVRPERLIPRTPLAYPVSFEERWAAARRAAEMSVARGRAQEG